MRGERESDELVRFVVEPRFRRSIVVDCAGRRRRELRPDVHEHLDRHTIRRCGVRRVDEVLPVQSSIVNERRPPRQQRLPHVVHGMNCVQRARLVELATKQQKLQNQSTHDRTRIAITNRPASNTELLEPCRQYRRRQRHLDRIA